MQKLSDMLRSLVAQSLVAQSLVAQFDPNDDPQNLYDQIRPLLTRLQLTGMVTRRKTELIPGKTQGENSLYKIVLERDAKLTDDHIARFRRERDHFDSIMWSAQAMEVYLWWPFKSPAIEPGPAPVGP